MKEETGLTTHPARVIATVRCASCGEVFTTRSTRSEIVVDVCSNCHPAYTGVQRSIQSGGRIDRFERRRARAHRTAAAA
jgi:large subunit ribosomal protein L31